MAGEINYFRKRFFGGFNRQDVVDYIEKLAGERNEKAEAGEKAIQDAKALAIEVAILQQKLEDIANEHEKTELEFEKSRLDIGKAKLEIEQIRQDVNKHKADTLEAVIKTFLELEDNVEGLDKEIRQSIMGVNAEMDALRATLSAVPEMLERAGKRFSELRAALKIEKDMVDTTEYQEPEEIADLLQEAQPEADPEQEPAADQEPGAELEPGVETETETARAVDIETAEYSLQEDETETETEYAVIPDFKPIENFFAATIPESDPNSIFKHVTDPDENQIPAEDPQPTEELEPAEKTITDDEPRFGTGRPVFKPIEFFKPAMPANDTAKPANESSTPAEEQD